MWFLFLEILMNHHWVFGVYAKFYLSSFGWVLLLKDLLRYTSYNALVPVRLSSGNFYELLLEFHLDPPDGAGALPL